jgi:hypothetical protein
VTAIELIQFVESGGVQRLQTEVWILRIVSTVLFFSLAAMILVRYIRTK